MMRYLFLLALLVSGGACEVLEPGDDDDTPGDDDDAVSPVEELTVGDEVLCLQPTSGMDRFSEESQARGLVHGLSDPGAIDKFLAWGFGGDIVAQDLDADGDLDLMFGRIDDVPDVYINDGTANFERIDSGIVRLDDRFETTSLSAVDVDDDGLPEVFISDGRRMLQFNAVGDGRFDSDPTRVHEETDIGPDTRLEWVTHNHGDPDQDGDLDLLLSTLGGGDDGFEGRPDLIAWNDDGWGEVDVLTNGVGTATLVGIWTDVDGDQRQDIFIPADLGPPSALFTNGGMQGERPAWTDVAPDRGADIVMSAMGVDAADLNGDGLLDYCMTDVGPPRCLQSDPSGIYLEPGPGLGLTPATWIEQEGTVGWSFDFADFDADGRLDAVQSSGPFPLEGDTVDYFDWPDLLWEGTATGFRDVTDDIPFGSVRNHVGVVTADFDGDGFLDIVTAGPVHPPELWMNTCSDDGWLLVELLGPSGNSEGIGAQVQVEAGDFSQVREVQTLRGVSQGPSRVHFGLGDRGVVDALTVRWPDGTTSRHPGIPTRRTVTVAHPDRVE